MRRFFTFLYAFTALSQLPFSVGIAQLIGGWAGRGAAVAFMVVFFALFRGRVALARWDRHISRLQRYALEEPFFVHWCASLLSLALMMVAVPTAVLVGRSMGEACVLSYMLALPFSFWGVVVRRRWVRVR